MSVNLGPDPYRRRADPARPPQPLCDPIPESADEDNGPATASYLALAALVAIFGLSLLIIILVALL